MRALKLDKEMEVFIAGLGAAQSLLLSVYSFLERKKDFRNLLLGLFFLAITIRLGKSILWVYLDTTPLWLINIGFIAHSITGPALFLYILHFLFPKKWSNWNLLHFVPSAVLLFYVGMLTLDGFWHVGGYTALLFQQIGYSLAWLVVLGIYFRLKDKRVSLNRATIIWISTLVLGTAVLQFLYFSNYILGITPYLLGPVSYLPFVYFLAFLLFKNPSLLKHSNSKKQQNIRLETHQLKDYASQMEQLMELKKLYLDPNCSLNKVATEMKLPAYLISHVVNNALDKSFPDFLNSYRIEEVKTRLLQPKNKNVKIASLAYDCGFNSLSSFNIAFKKSTGITPSKFLRNNASS
ncbi:helix-turn-helix domain-containing protein [Flagellimonas onchidii]|uniref:helix-turn-helix domain-containing protein n=1 Tax=Flagellimonas onchidii TaxID=2562684 RepID=UPI0010A5F9E3|nr:helix-turn-helix domain-containing protein [Allomuricauda onchidii]